MWRLVCAALLAAPASAAAFEVDLGLEGGGTLTTSQNIPGTQPSATAGLLVELRWQPRPLEWTLWVDIQYPYAIATDNFEASEGSATTFLADDLGLRLGLGVSPVRPYVGILLNASLPASGGGNTFAAVGGDLGLDVPWQAFRFGLELRALWSVTEVTSPDFCDLCSFSGPVAAASAAIFQALLSIRCRLL